MAPSAPFPLSGSKQSQLVCACSLGPCRRGTGTPVQPGGLRAGNARFRLIWELKHLDIMDIYIDIYIYP